MDNDDRLLPGDHCPQCDDGSIKVRSTQHQEINEEPYRVQYLGCECCGLKVEPLKVPLRLTHKRYKKSSR